MLFFHQHHTDPQRKAGLLPQVLARLAEGELLTSGATVVAECKDPCDLFGGDTALEQKYEILKSKRYGVAYVFFLTLARKENV